MKKAGFFALLTLLCSTACDSGTEDNMLCFVGDSIVARWDVGAFFPSRHTVNLGISGIGVERITAQAPQVKGREVVIIIGTNDLGRIKEDGEDAYARRYVEILRSLGATRLYVFSILPRAFKGDAADINTKIERVNTAILRQLEAQSMPYATYIDAYSDFMRQDHYRNNYSYDGLHPAPHGYEVLTQRLIQALK